MFDEKLATKHLNSFLKTYKIKVCKWSVTDCGRAYISKKEIKIPKPTNVIRFCICMHEIKHIIDGNKGKLYQKEFACEKFAIEQAESLGFDCSIYKEIARRYVVMNIAKGFCRGLNLKNIEPEIIKFCNVDFSSWEYKRVFVTGWGSSNVRIGKPLEIGIQ